jgi:hypothetical protein
MSAVTLELGGGPQPREGSRAGRLARAIAAIPPPPFDRLFAPVDRLRARLLRFVAPRFRSLVVDREVRVTAFAACLLISALVTTSLVPVWFLAIGPIVWGVPHVVSDFRYLVARPGYHRRPGVAIAVLAGLVAASFGFTLRGALAGAAAALLFARTTKTRRAIGILVLGVLFALAAWGGRRADLVFAHGHNAVAFGFWWAWRRRARKLHFLPLALFVGGAALILLGALDPVVSRVGLHAPWTGLSMRSLAHQLSPTMHGPWPMRLIVLYAFGQSAHYVVWMRLVPEEERPSPTPRSFAQSFRALHADMGSVLLWITLASAVALLAWAFVSLGAARNGYLQLAFFHGYLEIAAAALMWAEGRRAGELG